MLGVGPAELVIIIAIALVLFGAPVLTFLVGYSLGKRTLAQARDASQPDRAGGGQAADAAGVAAAEDDAVPGDDHDDAMEGPADE